MSNRLLPLIVLVLLAVVGATLAEVDDVQVKEKRKLKHHTESVRGKVVWLGEALQKHFNVSTVPESYQRALAIYTDQGQLLPLAEDLRGQSFRKDERLRGKPMELFVRRNKNHPMLQVIRIYEFKDGKKYEVDYWCDVCAIVMFEQGLCACCQDNNRLRHRLVNEKTKKNKQVKKDATLN